MYFVELSQRAHNFLEKLDFSTKERIETTLKRLETNPYPSDSKFISRDGINKVFRYRIGKFRALYSVDNERKIILVTKIDKRERVYD